MHFVLSGLTLHMLDLLFEDFLQGVGVMNILICDGTRTDNVPSVGSCIVSTLDQRIKQVCPAKDRLSVKLNKQRLRIETAVPTDYVLVAPGLNQSIERAFLSRHCR